VERTLPVPLSRIERLAGNPGRFGEWVEPLNRLERVGPGEYVADIGYFGQPNEYRMRSLGDGRLGLETVGTASELRWTVELGVDDEDSGSTRVRFVYEKAGSGTVFGASAESPLFQVSIEVLAERSLERLERRAWEATT
jgi:hypothetical protein